MKTGKKLFTGTLLALCAVLLSLCIVLAAGWSKAANRSAVMPEVRNSGTAIQWKYSDEADWRDLVALTELTGAAGENGKNGTDGKDGSNGTDGKNGINGTNGTNGKDGINGVDGKDGINGTNGKDGINGVDGKNGIDGKDGINAKNIEVQRAETHIQWRYEGGEWQNLVAIADITGPAGQNGADGSDGKTPEFRVNENTLQWRYVGDEIWLNLYDLTALKGADGIDGKDGSNGKDGANGINGSDGKDGNTPFIGENGNWWIGETDTGVKAAGTVGDKGDKGDKGDPGQNGGSSGYFYGTGYVPSTHLSDGAVPLYYREMHNRGGLISYNGTTLRLKKGHTYNVCVSGMVNAQTNDNSGKHSVQMTDGYDDDYCRYITLIEQSSRGSNSLCFNRIYDLTGAKNDVELKFSLEQGDYKTYLLSFRGSVTITALD